MTQDDKKAAAAHAALEFVEAGSFLGVGTGSTSNHFIGILAERRIALRGAVASSLATAERLRRYGFPVVELTEVGRLSLYVDGADEATREGFLIKGGGGALTREKILAAASERFVCIVDDSKLVERLGRFPLPVEVIPMAMSFVAREIERLGGRPVPRESFTTDNGHHILDVHGLTLDDPREVEAALDGIPGVVTNGLFCRRPADVLIVGGAGGVRRIK